MTDKKTINLGEEVLKRWELGKPIEITFELWDKVKNALTSYEEENKFLKCKVERLLEAEDMLFQIQTEEMEHDGDLPEGWLDVKGSGAWNTLCSMADDACSKCTVVKYIKKYELDDPKNIDSNGNTINI